MTIPTFSLPERASLARLPTPIEKLGRLSKRLGVDLYVKRDDLTGLVETGNKVRKLEFLVAEALREGADTLITCGTLQSNCARAVAAVSAKLGLKAILALKGEPASPPDGNLFLSRLLGAEIHYCSDQEFARIDAVLLRLTEEVRARGGKPYVIPESGATEMGALGYLVAAQELAQQVRNGAPAFDSVVITDFSGGSQAGLLMGKELFGLSAEVIGVPVAFSSQEVHERIRKTMTLAVERFGLPVELPKRVHLLDGFQGMGRSSSRPEELAMIREVAREEGLLLDPTYTAKAFLGLVSRLREDPKQFGQRVCFFHTGGVFSLFAFRSQLVP
ncbi:MAG TPA: D-cysteine desulfhydrase family protein [Methylomirabilota bacterium]|nr:D-cysteine desulfhydrase family protein [Methylomirabilota bacterium]